MAYNLTITEQAGEMMDRLVGYLICNLCNMQSAEHLIEEVSSIYVRLRENPYQFPKCSDYYLRKQGYRKAKVRRMKYVIIYRVDESKKQIYILGVFHELERYLMKLKKN